MAKYVKPTLKTKFHVDFSWWQGKGNNLRSYLLGHICPECKEAAKDSEGQTFDWVNPTTGEVFQVAMLWHIIQSHCIHNPDYIDSRSPLTSVIFRSFIVNNNQPLDPVELYDQIQKQSPDLILRTIGRRQVYKGIKPIS